MFKYVCVVLVLASVVFGGSGLDPNDPFECTIEWLETDEVMNVHWTVRDPNGLKHHDRLYRDWLEKPGWLDVDEVGRISPPVPNGQQDMDLVWWYEWSGLAPAGEYEIFTRDYDKRGNSFWMRQKIIVTPPDTQPPIAACGRVVKGGE